MNPDTGEFAKQAKSFTARQRYAQPDEIADFVAYLGRPQCELSYRRGPEDRWRLRCMSQR